MAVLTVNTNEKDPQRLAAALRQLAEGRSNAVGACTFSANANSTLVTAPNCSVSSFVLLMPTTTHAGWHQSQYSIVPANGSFRVIHKSNTFTDSTFGYFCVG